MTGRTEPKQLTVAECIYPLTHGFFRNIDVRGEDECWAWHGPIKDTSNRMDNRTLPYGYTHLIRTDGTRTYIGAHQVAWVIGNGTVKPARMEIDHTCGWTLCMNWDHLEVVTPAENKRRALIRRRAEQESRRRK